MWRLRYEFSGLGKGKAVMALGRSGSIGWKSAGKRGPASDYIWAQSAKQADSLDLVFFSPRTHGMGLGSYP
jgi:hypothetical protein